MRNGKRKGSRKRIETNSFGCGRWLQYANQAAKETRTYLQAPWLNDPSSPQKDVITYRS